MMWLVFRVAHWPFGHYRARRPPAKWGNSREVAKVTEGGGGNPESNVFEHGPFTVHLRRLHLTGRAPRPVLLRAAIASFLAWLPTVVLAIMQGVAWNDDPKESLLLDVRFHVLFLVALPLLVLAETSVLRRFAQNAAHFWNSGLVPRARRAEYDAAINSARRLMTSPWAALTMLLTAIAVVYTSQYWLGAADPGLSWGRPRSLGGEPSLALLWQRRVALPLFFGALLAWIWRFGVWGRFLLAMARLDLRVIASDPDGRGGLSFVSTSLPPCGLVGLAISASIAGGMMQRILHDGANPLEWKWVPVVPAAFMLLLSVTPLLVFYPMMWFARRHAQLEYNRLTLAVGYQFQKVWLTPPAGEAPDALQVNDFSATTDLFSIAANVYRMKILPFDLPSLVAVVVPTLLPFVPVYLTVVPLAELLQMVTRFLI